MRLFVVLVVVFGFIACDNGNTVAPEAGAGDLSGYQLENIPGTDLQMATRKDELGYVIERGFVKNGRREGAWSTYYTGEDAGRMKTLVTYRDGNYNGVYFEFSNRGQMTTERTYINNQLNGRSAKYHFGRLLEESEYKDGELHGIYKKFYESNGKLQSAAEFKNGKQDGYYRYYNEDGEVVMDYVYKDGEKVSGELKTTN